MTLLEPPRHPRRHAGRFATLAMLLALAAVDARAQGAVQNVPNAVQGFSQNRDKPIQIDAASLEVRDKEKAATFKGDVKVVQGDTTMRCKTLVVFYEGSATGAPATPAPAPAGSAAAKSTMTSATPGPTGSSSIRRLEAKGDVIVSQKDQTVTGEIGEFDMKTNTVTMRRNVVLTKGDNVLMGDRLIVDMTTGVSRVESDSGHVRGMFKSSGQNGQGGPQTPSLLPGAPAQGGHASASQAAKPMNLNDLTSSGRH